MLNCYNTCRHNGHDGNEVPRQALINARLHKNNAKTLIILRLQVNNFTWNFFNGLQKEEKNNINSVITTSLKPGEIEKRRCKRLGLSDFRDKRPLITVSLKLESTIKPRAKRRHVVPTCVISVCEPLSADTRGSMSMGRYGRSELRRTGTVRQSSTNKSFMCCLCKPLCKLFKPGKPQAALLPKTNATRLKDSLAANAYCFDFCRVRFRVGNA